MPKSVNIILNSNNALSGNTQESDYFVDWNALLDKRKKYWLKFVYLGGGNTFNGSKLATLYANFNTNNYTTGTQNTQMLGVLMPSVLAGSISFLQSLDNTNVPILLDTPPNNNNFSISIYDNSATHALFLDNNASPAVPAPYVLVLKFTEYDEDD